MTEDHGFQTRLWAPKSATPGEVRALGDGPFVLSRDAFGGEALTLSREANAHTVTPVSAASLEVWANPASRAALFVVPEWRFIDFQEGIFSPTDAWPVRPSELSRPRQAVLGERAALGMFREEPKREDSLPLYLVPLPGLIRLEPGERRRFEPPFTAVFAEAAAEFMSYSTLAPPSSRTTLMGPAKADVGRLSRELALPDVLDGATLRHAVAVPAEPTRGRAREQHRFPGSGPLALQELFVELKAELERAEKAPWLLLPVLDPEGRAHLALAYRSAEGVRVLLSTPKVRRFVEELEAVFAERQPQARATPWSADARRVASAAGAAPLTVAHHFGALSTRSVEMAHMLDELGAVASSNLRILLLGETGTGKDFVAREVHRASRRKEGPFVAFNVGSVSPQLIESELFGHKKGAFTGANTERPGLFREADGGTLFLDEIGDASPQVQIALLRALETGSVRPVGDTREHRTDVRVIAATKHDLKAAQQTGAFREDLYHRLNGTVLELPPLRKRKEDLPDLAHTLLQELSETDAPPPALSNDALYALLTHDWPGNIRELKTTLQAALVRARDATELRPEHLALSANHSAPPARALWFPPDVVELARRSIERQTLLRPERLSRRASRAVALYLHTEAPHTLTGTLKRACERLFEPGWEDQDASSLVPLLEHLNGGAPRAISEDELRAVLGELGLL